MTSTATYKEMTAQQALDRWDSGSYVWTIEMGGLGPSYEQCIQIGVFEFLRWLLKEKPSYVKGKPYTEEDRKARDAELYRIDDEFKLGLSGAQAGAIMSLATAFYMRDYGPCFSEVPDKRAIQVTKVKMVAA